VQDEKGNPVTDSHSSLQRWMNHFSQLLNVRGINGVSQTEQQTAVLIVPEPSTLTVRWLLKS
jgi:hypothetical protein